VKKEIKDPTQLNNLENRIKAYTHKIQIKSFLDEADKAEFIGNMKKALDQYQEGLYFLKKDNIDDTQKSNKRL
jgi:hypothetical protein